MDLTFEKTTPTAGERESWIAQFETQTNNTVVQVARTKGEALVVSAALDGMDFVPIQSFKTTTPSDLMFGVEIPAGVQIQIESYSEVTKAKTHNG